jgi:hypothetical protein
LAAAITFARVSGDTLAPSVKARDTADRETPARSATLSALIEAFFSFNFALVTGCSSSQSSVYCTGLSL